MGVTMETPDLSVSRNAYAKVNLGLSVLGRRSDGYHEVSTVMVAVGLYDRIYVTRDSGELSVFCPRLPHLPQETNLAYRGAKAYLESVGENLAFTIRIDKNIPVGAGMGGGSSDAAAAMLALRELTGKGEIADLMNVAAGLGADVPFLTGCNENPPLWEAAVCTGIGEKVAPLCVKPFWLVVAFLKTGVSTPWAFRTWDEHNSASDVPDSADVDPRSAKVVAALATGDPVILSQAIYNDLERAVVLHRPDIRRAKELLVGSGALNAVMTGSGSAVYGVCRSREDALGVRERARRAAGNTEIHGLSVIRTGVLG